MKDGIVAVTLGLDILWIYPVAGPADELEIDMTIAIKTAKGFHPEDLGG